ncbi:MAG: hypothetical protein R3A11_03085 [Bdellovibrionota bacterium]
MVEILSDKQRQAEDICLQGIDLYNQGEFAQAHKLFGQALGIDPESPKIQSWYGLTTGVVENYVTKGLEYCKRAVASDIPDVMFFRNLGKLYLLKNDKRSAIGAFARGLQIEKNNRAILAEWKTLGFRRKPFLGFLPRDHFLNVMIGKWTWKNRNRKNPPAPETSPSEKEKK